MVFGLLLITSAKSEAITFDYKGACYRTEVLSPKPVLAPTSIQYIGTTQPSICFDSQAQTKTNIEAVKTCGFDSGKLLSLDTASRTQKIRDKIKADATSSYTFWVNGIVPSAVTYNKLTDTFGAITTGWGDTTSFPFYCIYSPAADAVTGIGGLNQSVIDSIRKLSNELDQAAAGATTAIGSIPATTSCPTDSVPMSSGSPVCVGTTALTGVSYSSAIGTCGGRGGRLANQGEVLPAYKLITNKGSLFKETGGFSDPGFWINTSLTGGPNTTFIQNGGTTEATPTVGNTTGRQNAICLYGTNIMASANITPTTSCQGGVWGQIIAGASAQQCTVEKVNCSTASIGQAVSSLGDWIQGKCTDTPTHPYFGAVGLAEGQQVTRANLRGNVLTTESIVDLAIGWVRFALNFLWIIAVLALMYGGWVLVTDLGKGEGIKRAMGILKGVIFGILLIGFSYLIVNFVINIVGTVK